MDVAMHLVQVYACDCECLPDNNACFFVGDKLWRVREEARALKPRCQQCCGRCDKRGMELSIYIYMCVYVSLFFVFVCATPTPAYLLRRVFVYYFGFAQSSPPPQHVETPVAGSTGIGRDVDGCDRASSVLLSETGGDVMGRGPGVLQDSAGVGVQQHRASSEGGEGGRTEGGGMKNTGKSCCYHW